MTGEELAAMLPESMWIGGVRWRRMIEPMARRDTHFRVNYEGPAGRKLPLTVFAADPPWSTDQVGDLLKGARDALESMAPKPPTSAAAEAPTATTVTVLVTHILLTRALLCFNCQAIFDAPKATACPACSGAQIAPIAGLLSVDTASVGSGQSRG